jgi:chromosome partitioning protein
MARLNVVCLAATKGGVGKTTLASALAVRAAADGHRVWLVDADEQLSLSRWTELRRTTDNPKLASVAATPEGIGLLAADADWVFIDTPPAIIDIIEDAIAAADMVLIPTRTSSVDVLAMDDVAYLCERQGKPFAFVLNCVMAQWGKLTDTTADYLAKIGPVLSSRVGMRKPFVAAMTVGKSGPEMDRSGAAGREIDALWAELQAVMAKRPARKGAAHAR